MDLPSLRLRQGTAVLLEEAHREMLDRPPPTDMVFEKSWRSRAILDDCGEEEDILEGLSLSRWFLDLCRSVVVSCNSWGAKKQPSQRHQTSFSSPLLFLYMYVCVWYECTACTTCGMHVPICTHTCEGQKLMWGDFALYIKAQSLAKFKTCQLASAASLLREFPVFTSSSVLRNITRLFCQPCPFQ